MPIQEDYLSTSLRWALFKADCPDGYVEFSEQTSEELGIPASFSKNRDEKFCVATIYRFVDDKNPTVAYKSESDANKKDSDAWHVLCSKAMGRALKKAGYPDTMADLKTLIKFRNLSSDSSTVTNVVSATPVVTNVSSVAGKNIEAPVIKMESKETPTKPATGWIDDVERDEAHRNFKIRANDISDEEKEMLRSEHEKLNNRQWPMPKAELNTLTIFLEQILSSHEEVDVEEQDLVDIGPLRAMFTMLSIEAQEEIKKAYGEPDTWVDEIPENEYTQMIDMFATVSESD